MTRCRGGPTLASCLMSTAAMLFVVLSCGAISGFTEAPYEMKVRVGTWVPRFGCARKTNFSLKSVSPPSTEMLDIIKTGTNGDKDCFLIEAFGDSSPSVSSPEDNEGSDRHFLCSDSSKYFRHKRSKCKTGIAIVDDRVELGYRLKYFNWYNRRPEETLVALCDGKDTTMKKIGDDVYIISQKKNGYPTKHAIHVNLIDDIPQSKSDTEQREEIASRNSLGLGSATHEIPPEQVSLRGTPRSSQGSHQSFTRGSKSPTRKNTSNHSPPSPIVGTRQQGEVNGRSPVITDEKQPPLVSATPPVQNGFGPIVGDGLEGYAANYFGNVASGQHNVVVHGESGDSERLEAGDINAGHWVLYLTTGTVTGAERKKEQDDSVPFVEVDIAAPSDEDQTLTLQEFVLKSDNLKKTGKKALSPKQPHDAVSNGGFFDVVLRRKSDKIDFFVKLKLQSQMSVTDNVVARIFLTKGLAPQKDVKTPNLVMFNFLTGAKSLKRYVEMGKLFARRSSGQNFNLK